MKALEQERAAISPKNAAITALVALSVLALWAALGVHYYGNLGSSLPFAVKLLLAVVGGAGASVVVVLFSAIALTACLPRPGQPQ